MNAVVAPDRPAGNPLLDELGLLADGTRTRMLAILDGIELTVAELCEVVALPQSTVSRHLKTLADAGWVTARRDGTSRYYRLTVDVLAESSRRLWDLVREEIAATLTADHDRRRLNRVLEARRTGATAFFGTAAEEWDALRAELFGATSDLRLLPALLDPAEVVGDLGCGSGRVSATLAPYVREVVAVDPSPAMLELARQRVGGETNVRLLVGSLETLPVPDASLDTALVIHVLHHVSDTGRALAEAHRVLRPGGRLIVADMLPHANEEYRQTMGHVWLGFDRTYIENAFDAAGLVAERWHEPAIEAGAKGPGLFVATARRPGAAPPRTKDRDTPGGAR
jgi:ArsR family transcriptional regulator